MLALTIIRSDIYLSSIWLDILWNAVKLSFQNSRWGNKEQAAKFVFATGSQCGHYLVWWVRVKRYG